MRCVRMGSISAFAVRFAACLTTRCPEAELGVLNDRSDRSVDTTRDANTIAFCPSHRRQHLESDITFANLRRLLPYLIAFSMSRRPSSTSATSARPTPVAHSPDNTRDPPFVHTTHRQRARCLLQRRITRGTLALAYALQLERERDLVHLRARRLVHRRQRHRRRPAQVGHKRADLPHERVGVENP